MLDIEVVDAGELFSQRDEDVEGTTHLQRQTSTGNDRHSMAGMLASLPRAHLRTRCSMLRIANYSGVPKQ